MKLKTLEAPSEPEAAQEGGGFEVVPSGVQEAHSPKMAGDEPQKIDENDLLRYQLLGQKLQKVELLIQMYQRELERAGADRGALAKEARTQASDFRKKYGLDMTTHTITEDGYIVPRQG